MSDFALPRINAPKRRAGTLTDEVRAALEDMIFRGDLSAGVRLNESQLSEILGVSRGPIRDALRLLAQDGLVAISSNQGAVVRQHTIEDALEIYSLRALMAGYICASLARRATSAMKRELREILDAMAACIVSGDDETYFKLNLSFHDRIAEMSEAMRATELYGSLGKEVRLLRRRVLQGREAMQRSHEEHLQILAAIDAGDVEAARRAAQDHHESGKRRWLETLKR